jgi:hypothetical protein
MMLAQPHDALGMMIVLLLMLLPFAALIMFMAGVAVMSWGLQTRRKRAWTYGLGMILVSILSEAAYVGLSPELRKFFLDNEMSACIIIMLVSGIVVLLLAPVIKKAWFCFTGLAFVAISGLVYLWVR